MASDRIRRDSQETIVILDTNAILMLFEFSINLPEQLLRVVGKYRLVVPSTVIQELMQLCCRGDGRKHVHAKAALNYVKDFEQIPSDHGSGDDAVVFLAQQLHGIVLTNDKKLRQRLKDFRLPVIFLRKKQLLCIE